MGSSTLLQSLGSPGGGEDQLAATTGMQDTRANGWVPGLGWLLRDPLPVRVVGVDLEWQT
jgi:hypothetical protein